MLELFSKMHPFFKSEDGAGPVGGTLPEGSSKEDMFEFLSDDSEDETIPLTEEKPKDKTLPKGPKETKETDDEEDTEEDKDEDTDEEGEEDDELKDLEDEVEGPSDEQLELVTPVRRKEILKKYPELFKDFPYLEKAYYREQQYTELLPTIDDAREAVEAQKTLERYETDVLGGNIQTLLSSVKAENPESFYHIVDNYLVTLAEVDEKAYLHVISNVGKHTIAAMVGEAKRSNNKILQEAAQVLNQFLFMSSEFTPPTNLSKNIKSEDKSKEDEIKRERQEFTKQRFNVALGDINTKVTNSLRNTITANIDPKNSMTEYVKRHAIEEVMTNVEKLIQSDTRFKVIADKLWEAAFKDNFSRESTDRILSAYRSKAKTLLLPVIKRARIEALRGMGKRVREEKDEDNVREKSNSGRPRSQAKPSGKTKTEIPRGMTTLEFLNSD